MYRIKYKDGVHFTSDYFGEFLKEDGDTMFVIETYDKEDIDKYIPTPRLIYLSKKLNKPQKFVWLGFSMADVSRNYISNFLGLINGGIISRECFYILFKINILDSAKNYLLYDYFKRKGGTPHYENGKTIWFDILDKEIDQKYLEKYVDDKDLIEKTMRINKEVNRLINEFNISRKKEHQRVYKLPKEFSTFESLRMGVSYFNLHGLDPFKSKEYRELEDGILTEFGLECIIEKNKKDAETCIERDKRAEEERIKNEIEYKERKRKKLLKKLFVFLITLFLIIILYFFIKFKF